MKPNNTQNLLKQIAFFLLILVSLTKCTATHLGLFVTTTNKKDKLSSPQNPRPELTIYCTEISDLSNRYIGYLDIILENNSHKWIRLENIKLEFENDKLNKNIYLVSGQDLLSWKESMELRKKLEEPDIKFLFPGFKSFARTFHKYLNRKNLSKSVSAAFPGTFSSLTADSFNKKTESNSNTLIFPKNHLLHNDISIGPGLFINKFLILHSDKIKEIGGLSNITLTFNRENQKTEKIKVYFKSRKTSDFWHKSGQIPEKSKKEKEGGYNI